MTAFDRCRATGTALRGRNSCSSLCHRAISVLTDPADCGPVTLALPQDVQAEAYDYPEEFFATRTHRISRDGPDFIDLANAVDAIRTSRRPLIVAGGGIHYSGAAETLAAFSSESGIPVAETQAGKGAMHWEHPGYVGSIGVTGSSAANTLAESADLIIAIGTRLQDFTTGSGLLIGKDNCKLLSINVSRHDLAKRSALALKGDARRSLQELSAQLSDLEVDPEWRSQASTLSDEWNRVYDRVTTHNGNDAPSDAQVLGVVNKHFSENSTVLCAAGGLPGELHKLWRTNHVDGYHAEYGYSCMGYEIAGGMGAKMATPDREIVVMVGDGSYLMMNSELASSIALGQKIIVVLLDNRGFACINRLQTSLGGKGYNNLLDSSYTQHGDVPAVDFALHAAALGAHSEKVERLSDLAGALRRAVEADRSAVVVIETDPLASTEEGGTWWDVPVAEVSDNSTVAAMSVDYEDKKRER